MDKVWFILIDDKKEGPFTPLQLKNDSRVTPDVLVWKEGFKEWIAIRFVPELADLFKDKNVVKQEPDIAEEEPTTSELMQDQAALTIQQDPSQFILWIIIFVLMFIYAYYQFSS